MRMTRYAKERTRIQKRRSKARAGGRCVKCLKRRATVGMSHCKLCQKIHRTCNARRRNELAAAGICIDCRINPAPLASIICEDCSAIRRARGDKRVARLKGDGMCSACGKNPAKTGVFFCVSCTNKRNKQSVSHYRKRKRAGTCQQCGNECRGHGVVCKGCARKKIKNDQARRRKRLASGRCIRCGNSEFAELSGQSGNPHGVKMCEKCRVKAAAIVYLGSSRHWEILLDKLKKQDFKCAYTGIHLQLGVNASIDHILPKSRFPKLRTNVDNLHWVSMVVNRAKNLLTQDEFFALINTIHRYRELGKNPELNYQDHPELNIGAAPGGLGSLKSEMRNRHARKQKFKA